MERSKYTIGIDAGGTKVAYGLFDADGKMIDRAQHPTDASADGPGFCETLIASIRTLMEKNAVGFDRLEGIGLCMPSYLLFEQGVVCMTTAITGIRGFPLRDYLAQRLPTRIALDNDSNAAALAEYRHGAGRGSRHMVYMAVSTGVGSGILINGSLFRGSYGWAGECGHMLLTPDEGVECGCRNRGCVMSYVGGRFVPQHIKNRLDAGEISSLASAEQLDCVALLAACRAGDRLAVETVEQMAHHLAVCVYNVYQVLNINLFVFGGGLVHFGDELFGRMRAEFDRYDHLRYPVEFRFAELGGESGVIGAAELVKE